MRKFLFVEDLQELIDEFWAYIKESDDIPTIEGLCKFLGTNRDTLAKYAKNDSFADTIKNCKNDIFCMQKQLAMVGRINASVFIFNAKNNYGYVDRIETLNKTLTVSCDVVEANDIIDTIVHKRIKHDDNESLEPLKELPSSSNNNDDITPNTKK